jgi:hypothetical protein
MKPLVCKAFVRFPVKNAICRQRQVQTEYAWPHHRSQRGQTLVLLSSERHSKFPGAVPDQYLGLFRSVNKCRSRIVHAPRSFDGIEACLPRSGQLLSPLFGPLPEENMGSFSHGTYIAQLARLIKFDGNGYKIQIIHVHGTQRTDTCSEGKIWATHSKYFDLCRLYDAIVIWRTQRSFRISIAAVSHMLSPFTNIGAGRNWHRLIVISFGRKRNIWRYG